MGKGGKSFSSEKFSLPSPIFIPFPLHNLHAADPVSGDAALKGLAEPRGIVALGVEGLGSDLPFEVRIEKEEVGGRAGLERVD